MLARELTGLQAPRPVALAATGRVHPRLAPEAEDVLRGHDGKGGARVVGQPDQRPVRLGRIELRLGIRTVPADRGVVVVGARIDELALAVVPWEERVARVAVERELEHGHAGELELVS